jgi:hypothetical protein
MALAEFGEAGAIRHIGGATAWLGGQYAFERRAPQAGLARIVGAGCDQNGTAGAHITGDIVEIDDRQHALACIAIEDDELELIDLLLEQFAGREGDQ